MNTVIRTITAEGISVETPDASFSQLQTDSTTQVQRGNIVSTEERSETVVRQTVKVPPVVTLIIAGLSQGQGAPVTGLGQSRPQNIARQPRLLGQGQEAGDLSGLLGGLLRAH